MAGTTGPVRWLAFPRSMGYEQNPISVYYCYAKGATAGRNACCAVRSCDLCHPSTSSPTPLASPRQALTQPPARSPRCVSLR